jgi:hypothetical protein
MLTTLPDARLILGIVAAARRDVEPVVRIASDAKTDAGDVMSFSVFKKYLFPIFWNAFRCREHATHAGKAL